MDRRERNHQWFSTFDEARMLVTIEEFERGDGEVVDLAIPVRYEVCGTCDGKGSHVNPSIDSHGLSREDFDADPDFREDYLAGAYDVPCNECDGRRVVPVVDEQRATPEQREAAERTIDGLAQEARERAYEQRMGY